MKKINDYIHLMRPHQYVKNGFVWLPLFFGYQLQNHQAILNTFFTFLIFCIAASNIYVFNDIKDVNEDRQHPVKRFRPVASGNIKKKEAWTFFCVLFVLTLSLGLFLLPLTIISILAGYLVLNIFYTNGLKHIAIIDIVCIATGFVLRVIAGGKAASVQISPWIVIMTFLLALFLALAKRRDDLLLSDKGHNTRKSLDGYNLEFVSQAMGVMASVIIVSYILYTVSPEIIAKHGTQRLYLTSFWVIVGLLRYMQLTFVEIRSGSPTLILLKDLVLQGVVLLWLLSLYLLLYHPFQF